MLNQSQLKCPFEHFSPRKDQKIQHQSKKKQFSEFLTTLHRVFAELLYKENCPNKIKGSKSLNQQG